MRILKYNLYCIILFLIFIATTLLSDVKSSEIQKVTIRELLAQKEKFLGKRIEVVGYYYSSFESCALYENEDKRQIGKSLWLFPDTRQGYESKVKYVEKGYVRVIGVFDYRSKFGTGHFNQWPARIIQIELFEKLQNEKGVNDTTRYDECITNRSEVNSILRLLKNHDQTLAAETNFVKLVDNVLLDDLATRVQSEKTNIVVNGIRYFTTQNLVVAQVYTREEKIWYYCGYYVAKKKDWGLVLKLVSQ